MDAADTPSLIEVLRALAPQNLKPARNRWAYLPAPDGRTTDARQGVFMYVSPWGAPALLRLTSFLDGRFTDEYLWLSRAELREVVVSENVADHAALLALAWPAFAPPPASPADFERKE